MKTLTMFILLSCMARGAASAAEAGLGFPIVDAHTHAEFSGKTDAEGEMPYTLEEYLKERREAGVAACVAHESRASHEFKDLSGQRVIQCGGVDEKVDVRGLEAGLKAGRYRCLKIYLGYVHRWAYDKAYEPVYRLAERYKVPVVFHTGDTYDDGALLKYADPLTIDEVAVAHPKVDFVLGHMGNPWIQSAAEVAYKNKNVYIEFSALLVGDLRKTESVKVEEYIVKPIRWAFGYVDDPKKFMYGTDWPLVEMKLYLDACKKAVPPEHWKAIFQENAARVFKLPSEWLTASP